MFCPSTGLWKRKISCDAAFPNIDINRKNGTVWAERIQPIACILALRNPLPCHMVQQDLPHMSSSFNAPVVSASTIPGCIFWTITAHFIIKIVLQYNTSGNSFSCESCILVHMISVLPDLADWNYLSIWVFSFHYVIYRQLERDNFNQLKTNLIWVNWDHRLASKITNWIILFYLRWRPLRYNLGMFPCWRRRLPTLCKSKANISRSSSICGGKDEPQSWTAWK